MPDYIIEKKTEKNYATRLASGGYRLAISKIKKHHCLLKICNLLPSLLPSAERVKRRFTKKRGLERKLCWETQGNGV